MVSCRKWLSGAKTPLDPPLFHSPHDAQLASEQMPPRENQPIYIVLNSAFFGLFSTPPSLTPSRGSQCTHCARAHAALPFHFVTDVAPRTREPHAHNRCAPALEAGYINYLSLTR